jgi:hypothetical protein
MWLCALTACMACGPQLIISGQGGDHASPPQSLQRAQALVNESKARLSIAQDVEVSIVEKNPLVVSVEPLADHAGVFRLLIEGDFLASLSEEELRAVVAHELGHVWIFTHFPYLQTELLANQIAMQIVTRESLEPVYAKVWKRIGAQGNLTAFLGEK